MPFLALTIALTSSLYAVEALYFRKRFGFFAALFWLSAVQMTVLTLAALAVQHEGAASLPGWLKVIGGAATAFAYLTVGLTPVLAGVAGIIAAGYILFTRSTSPRR